MQHQHGIIHLQQYSGPDEGGLCAMWEQCWTTVSISSFNAGDEISGDHQWNAWRHTAGAGADTISQRFQPSGMWCRNGTYVVPPVL